MKRLKDILVWVAFAIAVISIVYWTQDMVRFVNEYARGDRP